MVHSKISLFLFLSVMVNKTVLLYLADLSDPVCKTGYYGWNCHLQCHCLQNVQCKEGKCEGLCEGGYKNFPYCNESCPTKKFGINCTYDCHCINDEDCGKRYGDCPSRQCHHQYEGAGCQRRLPRLVRAPTIIELACQNVTLKWMAFDKEVDVGEGAVGQYIVQTKSNESLSWYNPINVTDKQDGVHNYTITFSDGLEREAYQLFRIDTRATANGELIGKVQVGLETFPILHTCRTCPTKKFGINCTYDCHCINDEECDKRYGDCPSKQCHHQYDGAACQRRLPRLVRAPTIVKLSCQNVTLKWMAFDKEVDIGEGAVGQYIVQTKSNESLSWYNPINVTDKQDGVLNYTITFSDGLVREAYQSFRIDTRATAYGKLTGKVQVGLETFPVLHTCRSEVLGEKSDSNKFNGTSFGIGFASGCFALLMLITAFLLIGMAAKCLTAKPNKDKPDGTMTNKQDSVFLVVDAPINYAPITMNTTTMDETAKEQDSNYIERRE